MNFLGMRCGGFVFVVAVVATVVWVNAGPLAPPPGPVGSTGRFGPRTDIHAGDLPVTISAPGSYYLAENIVTAGGGITIDADGVTLDLMGFTLTGGAGDGILVTGSRRNIAIKNGTVSGWGGDGVDAGGAANSELTDLRASDNGGFGLRIGGGSTVTHCAARDNGLHGLSATGAGCAFQGCTARSNTFAGINMDSGSTATGCVALLNSGNGIQVGSGCTLSDCTARSNGGDGINAPAGGSTITGCAATANTGDGIEVSSYCRVAGNVVEGNDGAGIHVSATNNRIRDNHVTGSGRGLHVEGAGNVVANNTVKGNTDNYDIAADNRLGILLCEVPETIDWPATVTLAGSLTGESGQNGITVNADNVTIDLAGHALIGVSGSLDGINVAAGPKNAAIGGGTIRNWGGDGVDAFSAVNCRLENLRASNNGAHGLAAGTGSTISLCTTRENGGQGIRAGAANTVSNCTSSKNTGDGIFAGNGSTVTGCTAAENTVDGVVAFRGVTVSGCTAFFNTGDGIAVSLECRVVGNNCASNGASGGDGAGIHATASRNAILRNHCTNNDRGLDIDNATNYSSQNTLSGNTVDEDLGGSNEGAGDLANVVF